MITSKQINTNVLINRKDTIFLKNELKKKMFIYLYFSLVFNVSDEYFKNSQLVLDLALGFTSKIYMSQ